MSRVQGTTRALKGEGGEVWEDGCVEKPRWGGENGVDMPCRTVV